MPTDPSEDRRAEDTEGDGDPEPDPAPEAAPGETDDGPCAAARLREGPHVDNGNWTMAPLDDDRNPSTTAAISATWSLSEGGGMPFPVSGLLPAAVPARIDVVAWEGDADLRGDRVAVDGHVVASSGGYGEADNAFTGSARGAVGDPLTFGADVVRFDSVLGRETDIRILSEQDAVLVGAVARTAPMRT